MSIGDATRSVPAGAGNGAAVPERLSLGVAARLSRYLQVLTQAKKMGKETISSQELSDYTHVNSTQIRRDLSGFGKFGKRGVGLWAPPPALCVDNAAMIAGAARFLEPLPYPEYLAMDAAARLS